MGARENVVMSNFTRIVNCTGEIWKFHVQDVILWSLTFIFSGSHKKFSLVLLHMTNYICSPWKMYKRMQYALSYSDTVTLFRRLKIKITQFPDGFRLHWVPLYLIKTRLIFTSNFSVQITPNLNISRRMSWKQDEQADRNISSINPLFVDQVELKTYSRFLTSST